MRARTSHPIVADGPIAWCGGVSSCRECGGRAGAAGQNRTPDRTARRATQHIDSHQPGRRARSQHQTIRPSPALSVAPAAHRRVCFGLPDLAPARRAVARPTPIPSEEMKRGTSTNRIFKRPKRHRATRLRNPRDRARRGGRSDCPRSRTPTRRRRAIPQLGPVGRPRPSDVLGATNGERIPEPSHNSSKSRHSNTAGIRLLQIPALVGQIRRRAAARATTDEQQSAAPARPAWVCRTSSPARRRIEGR